MSRLSSLQVETAVTVREAVPARRECAAKIDLRAADHPSSLQAGLDALRALAEAAPPHAQLQFSYPLVYAHWEEPA